MSIEVKQKIKEVADDFAMPAKKLIEIVGTFYDRPKSSSQNLTEEQLNVIFDYITQKNQISSLEEVFAETKIDRWFLNKLKGIIDMEELLKNSEVMGDHPDDGTINIGSHVTIREVGTDFDMDIEIVGASEANSLTRRISNESPVGKELMHKQQGEIVSVETADGLIKYEILKVEPPKA